MTNTTTKKVQCDEINKAFIEANKWENIWSQDAKYLDIVEVDNKVYQIIRIESIGYNEALDLFEDKATLKACFLDEVITRTFHMNIKINKLITQIS